MSFNVYYPPTVPYDTLKQRPQHLFKYLARLGVKCYFCESEQKGKPAARTVEENLVVLNGFLQTNFKGPLVYYFTYPDHVKHIGKIKEDLVVFDSVDEPVEEFAHWAPDYEKALKTADIVFASAQKLLTSALEINPNSHLVTNGVEYDFFSKPATSRAIHLKKLNPKVPTIGFYGAIASWIDFTLIFNAALQRPDWQFVIVGPNYNVTLPHLPPNVTRVMHVQYEELPKYLACFDVCLVPFKPSKVADSCNPLKMWEYLAAGKPVVVTNIIEAPKAPIVYHATTDNFVDTLEKALAENTPELKALRQAYAHKNSWENKAKKVYSEILLKITNL
jgi:glycosyltransferase involved in cell wall biosynthesis